VDIVVHPLTTLPRTPAAPTYRHRQYGPQLRTGRTDPPRVPVQHDAAHSSNRNTPVPPLLQRRRPGRQQTRCAGGRPPLPVRPRRPLDRNI